MFSRLERKSAFLFDSGIRATRTYFDKHGVSIRKRLLLSIGHSLEQLFGDGRMRVGKLADGFPINNLKIPALVERYVVSQANGDRIHDFRASWIFWPRSISSQMLIGIPRMFEMALRSRSLLAPWIVLFMACLLTLFCAAISACLIPLRNIAIFIFLTAFVDTSIVHIILGDQIYVKS